MSINADSDRRPEIDALHPPALCRLHDPASLPVAKRASNGVQSGDCLPAILACFQVLNHHFLAPRSHLIGYVAVQRALRWMSRRFEVYGSIHTPLGGSRSTNGRCLDSIEIIRECGQIRNRRHTLCGISPNSRTISCSFRSRPRTSEPRRSRERSAHPCRSCSSRSVLRRAGWCAGSYKGHGPSGCGSPDWDRSYG